MARDNDIRDLLVGELDLIEPGLELIEKNYYLRNDDGSSGFVDILARDSTGLITVIELKKSDSSGRKAIHVHLHCIREPTALDRSAQYSDVVTRERVRGGRLKTQIDLLLACVDDPSLRAHNSDQIAEARSGSGCGDHPIGWLAKADLEARARALEAEVRRL